MFGPLDWVAFGDLMAQQAKVSADSATKADQLCISPAIYAAGSYRSKAAAMGWDWFAADIDNKAGNRPGATIDEIVDVMDALGSPYLIYTTASHQPEAQCFRLMFPLDRMIQASEFDSVWRSFAIRFGCFDEQTKDISRLFIAPRSWHGRASRFLRCANGTPVCVDEIVRASPAPVEAEIDPVLTVIAQEELRGRRIVDNLTDLATSPVVPRRAVDTALTASPGGRMFRFLCSVACSARRKGYILDTHELKQIGMQLAMLLGKRDNSDLARDVRNALAFADCQIIAQRADQLGRLRQALTGRR
jgi:hypothetical protein